SIDFMPEGEAQPLQATHIKSVGQIAQIHIPISAHSHLLELMPATSAELRSTVAIRMRGRNLLVPTREPKQYDEYTNRYSNIMNLPSIHSKVHLLCYLDGIPVSWLDG